MATASNTAKEINCRTTLLLRNYILRYHADAYEPFLGICAENGLDEIYLLSENHWVSFEFVNRLYDFLYEYTRDPYIMYHVGFKTDELIPTTLPVILFKTFRSPRFAFKQCMRFSYLFEKISKVRLLDMGSNHAVIEEEFESYHQTWHSYQYGRGIYARIPGGTGKQLVSADMLECSVPIYRVPLFFDQFTLDGDYVIDAEGMRVGHRDAPIRFRGTLYNSKNDVHRIVWRSKRKPFAMFKRGREEREAIFERLERDVVELEEKADLLMELDLASRVQKFFFPKEKPESDEWDIAYCFRPMTAVSGDIYDFYLLEDCFRGVGLFDVTGHGVAAGLITMMAKSIIYRNFRTGLADDNLGNVLGAIARELFDDLQRINYFITGVILRLHGPEVVYVNSGHHQIIVYSSEEKKFREITDPEGNSVGGMVLGLESEGNSYNSARFQCGPKDLLVLFTDGIVEQRNRYDVEFGIKRLRTAIENAAGSEARVIVDRIMGDLTAFNDNATQYDDDCTLIVLVKK